MADDEVKVLRVTTGVLSGPDGLESFRETFGRNILGIEMEPLEDHHLNIDMLLYAFQDFAIASGCVSQMRNFHPAALIKDDDIILTVVSGQGELTQYGRVAPLAAGDAVLTANGAVANFAHYTSANVLNLRLNRSMLAAHVADVDAMIAKPIPRNSDILKLIIGYTSALKDQRITPSAVQGVFSAHIHELVAMLVGGADTSVNGAQGIRAARLVAIKRYISDNIQNHSLSVEHVSRKLQISETYVRKLLAADNTSFSDLVAEMRLIKAHRMLTSPMYAGHSIIAIAHEAGFSDASYFNRLFRRRFGKTPSDVRRK